MKNRNFLNNHSINTLINLANIESGLLDNNFVAAPEDLNKFVDIKLGIPILIPADEKIFDFQLKDVFEIEKNTLLSIVYSHQDEDYVGFKHSFRKFKFLSKINVKKRYREPLNYYVQQNRDTFRKVSILKKTFKKIGAFQTRNIPHFGHEIIMKRMLALCDHLVINPVVGPKKRGDTTIKCLNYVFTDLLENRYQQKMSFIPIFANMFYAGPREAVHHSLIRKRLGFDLFSVGRDHAGAENIYREDEAPILIEKIKKDLGIDVMTHYGAKFCKFCNKVVLYEDCRQKEKYLLDISGTEFRDNILKKTIFDLADEEMQKNLFETSIEIFES